MSVAAPIYQVRGVRFAYDATPVLDGLHLDVAEGERVAVLGANGSGKSTLLRLLDGLCFPAAGSIAFRGAALTEPELQKADTAFDFRRRVGFVFQNPEVQLFNPTVFDEVAFGPLQLRWKATEVRDRVRQAMESMGLTGFADRPPHRLSQGEKKRVALASVLVLDPEVLLLDEPTAALDPRTQSQVVDMIGAAFAGKTVITATHELPIVQEIAGRVVVLEGGKVAAEGPPRAILDDLPLLERTNLIHVHRHHHPGGEVHAHPHVLPGHRH